MEKKELTIADVWAILAESSAMHKEIDQIMKESAQRMEETDRRMEETARQMKETDRQMKETDRRFKELDKKLDKLCVKVGGIDDNQGHHAEQFFQDVFRKKLEFGGVKYDEMVPNLAYKGKKYEIEFDIALVNGEPVALIEVKNQIHPDFVKILAEERVEKFREFFHEFDNYDVYLGIAGFSFSDEVLDRASTYGIGIIKQVGEGVEIEANNLKAY
jgi:hypothetical protein